MVHVALGADVMTEHVDVARLPPLHAPFDRELLARVGPWEVRRHADDRVGYFATRALLHLQLWHPTCRVSVLTPSRLTADRFEIATETRRARVDDWAAVLDELPDHDLPGGSELATFTMWLVVRCEITARRACSRSNVTKESAP
jgi:hypothetical protein